MDYPFGPWLPDEPDINNRGMIRARNCIPVARGYGSLRSLQSYSPAIDTAVRGAIAVADAEGNVYNYAGDAGKLYQLTATAATDRSIGGGYALGAEEYWAFDLFNNELVAVSVNEDSQKITLGGANFADLGGSPPRANHIANIRTFAVMGNTWDSTDGYVENRIIWSAINDIEGWTVGTNQSDFQDLPGNNGAVQGFGRGEYGVIIQERAISRMTFVGPPTIFQIDELETGRGTFAPRSIAQVGHLIYYLGHDGFYVFDGSQSHPLGKNMVDKTFYTELDDAYIHRISATVDPINKLIVWAYPTGNSLGDGDPDKLLIYDYVNRRWSDAEMNLDMLVPALSTSETLESLDAISGSIDALSHSLDSRIWAGGSPVMAAFTRDDILSFFTGPVLEGDFISAGARLNPRGSALVDSILPYVDGTVTVDLGHQNNYSDAITWSGPMALNSIGEADIRQDARFFRVRLRATDWTEAQGIDFMFSATGHR